MTSISSNYSRGLTHQLANNQRANHLLQIKNYTSEFSLVNRAIRRIPTDIHALNVANLFRKFNDNIAGYRDIIHPLPTINCLEELMGLEEDLNASDHALGKLWFALAIAHKPRLNTINQIRKWVTDVQNQPLLDGITEIDLQSCEINRLPREIFKLRNVRKIDLSDNKLFALPTEIGCFQNLQELNLNNNYLRAIPREIAQCTSLISLDISNNVIERLPEEIRNLTSIIRFCAANNYLEVLPEGLDWNLQTVDLSGNPGFERR